MAEDVTVWDGCYGGGWRGIISPDSFRHPAKMAYGLLSRIIKHGVARGWWKPGDVIGDPFGGVGTTGLLCSYSGLRSVSVELEPKFVGFSYDNFYRHLRSWQGLGNPLPVYLQGDSRRFAEVVGGVAGIATSPPSSNISPEKSSSGIDIGKNWETYRASGGGLSFEKYVALQARHSEGYGREPGQIGALPSGSLDAVATSPPYSNSLTRGDKLPDSENSARMREMGGRMEYGQAGGQIGELPEGELDGAVTSPPYAQSL